VSERRERRERRGGDVETRRVEYYAHTHVHARTRDKEIHRNT